MPPASCEGEGELLPLELPPVLDGDAAGVPLVPVPPRPPAPTPVPEALAEDDEPDADWLISCDVAEAEEEPNDEADREVDDMRVVGMEEDDAELVS